MAHTSDSQFAPAGRRLRSQAWFDNPENPAMTALYLERYLNDGITLAELTSGKPIIGIAQTGSDLCGRLPAPLITMVSGWPSSSPVSDIALRAIPS